MTELQPKHPHHDHAEIISLMELLAFVAFACAASHFWKGDLGFYITDNANVQTWLNKRRPKNRFASLSRIPGLSRVSPAPPLTSELTRTQWQTGPMREELITDGWTGVRLQQVFKRP